jgi:hypothetical protein
MTPWWRVTLRTSMIGAVAISESVSLRQRARSARGSAPRMDSPDAPGPEPLSHPGSVLPPSPATAGASPGGWSPAADPPRPGDSPLADALG